MEILLWIVCVLLGFAAYMGFNRGWGIAVDRLSDHQRSRSYHVAKNFPGIVFTTVLSLAFFAALGATVIHYAVAPFVGSALREATSWGPGTAGGMLVLLVFGFWSGPIRRRKLPHAAAP